jgi:hypothetical protein
VLVRFSPYRVYTDLNRRDTLGYEWLLGQVLPLNITQIGLNISKAQAAYVPCFCDSVIAHVLPSPHVLVSEGMFAISPSVNHPR